MSMSAVAERTECNEGSVIGLCRSVGATGFQQLKMALAQEMVLPVHLIHENLLATDASTAVLVVQQPDKHIRWYSFAVIEALCGRAAMGPQEVHLLRGFHAFRQHVHVEAVRHGDDRAD
jgi:hypothetical protein